MIALRIGMLQVTLLPFCAKICIFQFHVGSARWLWGGFWCNSEMRCSSSTLRAPCRAVNYHLFEPLPAPLVFSIFNAFSLGEYDVYFNHIGDPISVYGEFLSKMLFLVFGFALFNNKTNRIELQALISIFLARQ